MRNGNSARLRLLLALIALGSYAVTASAAVDSKPKRFALFSAPNPPDKEGNVSGNICGATLLRKVAIDERRCHFAFGTAAHCIPTERDASGDNAASGNTAKIAYLSIEKKSVPPSNLEIAFGPKYRSVAIHDNATFLAPPVDDFALVSFSGKCESFDARDRAFLAEAAPTSDQTVSLLTQSQTKVSGKALPLENSGAQRVARIGTVAEIAANPIQSGDSGAAVVDASGRLVGFLSSKSDTRERETHRPVAYGFSFSPNAIDWLKDQLKK